MKYEFDARSLLPPDLPDGRQLVEEGRARARQIDMPVTLYARNRGVRSTREWKEHVREAGGMTSYINLGYKTWAEERDALEYVMAKGRELGFVLDRVSLTAERRMGLPASLRDQALEETGIMFNGHGDWLAATQDLDVSVVINDHNLGSPASIENTEMALRAGFDYVGNVAQHNYGYALWDDDIEQMIRTVSAYGMVAEKRHEGVVAESYIEDGDCAGFHDLATSIGWCLFHRYVIEDLVGAAHSQSYGSTLQDPVLKMAFGLAMEAINVHRVPPSFVHGDTNSFTVDGSFERNAAMVYNDVFHTALREIHQPTGASLHATPVSEALRIPSEDDIVQSLLIVDEAWKRAHASQSLIDWRPVHELRDRLIRGGYAFYRRMMAGFSSIGIDTSDPLQLVLAARRIGGGQIEQMFGVGKRDTSYPRGFEPTVSSDTLRRHLKNVSTSLDRIRASGECDLSNLKIVAASADIHEYGLFVVTRILEALGAEVTDLGTSVPARDIAKVVVETDADVVALSTYNGGALSLGRQVLDELQARDVAPSVFMGGRLNEDLPGAPASDVVSHLRDLGVLACYQLDDMVDELRKLGGVDVPSPAGVAGPQERTRA